MSVVVYKCDTCKRVVELKRNPKGIERVQRCVITHGCRGKLYQTDVKQDYSRGSLPDDVIGLDNWRQRKVLYNHYQTIERSTWNVQHKLGTYPSISVFVDRPTADNATAQEEIIPTDVIIVDSNNIKLVFDRPWSGTAQVVARQSNPNILHPVPDTVDVTQPAQQISNLGEITIATKLQNPDPTVAANPTIGVQLSYNTTQRTSLTINYEADDNPSTNSAWSDANRIIIKGQSYIVRSFDGITSAFTNGNIGNGSTFTFTGIDRQNTPEGSPPSAMGAIEPEDVLILLSSNPFGVYDKLKTKYIDVTDITDTVNPFGLYYNSEEFFAVPDVVNSTYPPIKIT